MGRLIKTFWDCSYCQAKDITGDNRTCPNCGKARDNNTTFHINLHQKIYVPDSEAVHINRNPDWVCNYCDSLNSDKDKFCASCGAPRTKENLNYFQNHRKRKSEHSVNAVEVEPETITDSSSSTSERFNQAQNFINSNLHIFLAVVASLAFLVGLVFLLIPKEHELTVQELSWEYNINIERYQTVQESDWYLPSGARLLSTRLEISGYEPVLDHYETRTHQVSHQEIVGYEEYVSGYRDLGNGYAEEIISYQPIYQTYYDTETYQEPIYRDEPIYSTKYYYEIDKWLYERTVTTSGNDKSTYWGEPNLNSDERISSKKEIYSFVGIDEKGKDRNIELSYEDWSSLDIGQTVKVKVSLGFGEIVK